LAGDVDEVKHGIAAEGRVKLFVDLPERFPL
jgi:hypothetical protein